MFRDIVIGQYVSGSSPLHRLDARVKLILTIAYIALVFMADTWAASAVAVVFTASLVMISQIPLRFIFKGLKPVLWILVFTALINIFVSSDISAAAYVSVRLILIVVSASLLTLTTPPLSLTDGIERLLSPLEKVKVPARDIAMMMSVAIRFIPTFSEEAQKIRKAQLSRGADFESGNLIARARALTPLIIPLFMSAIRRADALAEAMDARCYGKGGRTRLRELKITRLDILAVTVFIIGAAALLATEFVIEF